MTQYHWYSGRYGCQNCSWLSYFCCFLCLVFIVFFLSSNEDSLTLVGAPKSFDSCIRGAFKVKRFAINSLQQCVHVCVCVQVRLCLLWVNSELTMLTYTTHFSVFRHRKATDRLYNSLAYRCIDNGTSHSFCFAQQPKLKDTKGTSTRLFVNISLNFGTVFITGAP